MTYDTNTNNTDCTLILDCANDELYGRPTKQNRRMLFCGGTRQRDGVNLTRLNQHSVGLNSRITMVYANFDIVSLYTALVVAS